MSNHRPAIFKVSERTSINASRNFVYYIVSHLENSANWNQECTGGKWIIGRAGELGSVFEGANQRGKNPVSWAPVVRGAWTTRAEVIEAKEGESFAWAMLNSEGFKQDSVWRFKLDKRADGVTLTHEFIMGSPTEGIQQITRQMSPGEKLRFFKEWELKLERDLSNTVSRIKAFAEEKVDNPINSAGKERGSYEV